METLPKFAGISCDRLSGEKEVASELENGEILSKDSFTQAREAFLRQLLSTPEAGSKWASTSAATSSTCLQNQLLKVKQMRITVFTHLWLESSSAERIYASHTIQSLILDSASWPDSSIVRALFSKAPPVSKRSCHCWAASNNLSLNLQSCHSPFAIADSGPREGSWRYSRRCSSFPCSSVILCKSSSSWGDWIDRVGSCFGSCQDQFDDYYQSSSSAKLLTLASLVDVAIFPIRPRASPLHIFLCFSGYLGHI